MENGNLNERNNMNNMKLIMVGVKSIQNFLYGNKTGGWTSIIYSAFDF